MNNTWSFYSLSSGKFSGAAFTGKEKHLPLNTPDGYGALRGIFTVSQCVDLDTMNVMSCQPDKPADTDTEYFEWEDDRWVAKPTLRELTSRARNSRDQKLSSCDWTQLPDAPLSEEELQAWRSYRQALRDVPDQQGFPSDIDWPTEPAGISL
jgi:hypothetical protein